MTPAKHVAISVVTAAGFGFFTKSWAGGLACFLSGIFIDLDHVLDFIIFEKRLCKSLKELERFCEQRHGKIYLFLHSFELLLILWITVFYFHFEPIWLGIVFGLTVHMVADQIVNPVNPWTYFILYRAKLKFPRSIFFEKISKDTHSHV